MKLPRSFSLRRQEKAGIGDLVEAFDRFPEAFILRDGEGKIRFVNRKTEDVFRVRRSEIVGYTAMDLTEREHLWFRSALQFVPERNAARFVLPEGERTHAFVVSDVAIVGKRGEALYLRVLRETTREDELSRLKTQFISAAAHQIRTPISGIHWVVSMFLAGEVGPLTPAQRDLLARTAQTIDRLNRLINDLLDVTRIEEGRFEYAFKTEMNFSGFLEQNVENLRPKAVAKGIALVFRKPDQPLPPLQIDEGKLSLAIENIVGNAIAYTMRGGVEVSVERRDDVVDVVVRDTGIGIPTREQPNLFTKFFRGSNAMELGAEGTGLGLFIVQHIVRRHGGVIAIASEEGKGTTITMTLPIDPKRIPHGAVPLEDVMI